jgi:CRP-like cAMP-binding protein
MTEKEDLIRKIPLFAALPSEELRLLASSLHPSSFSAGTILFYEGDPGESFSILTQGQVEIIQAFGTLEETHLEHCRSGGFPG